MIPMKSNQNPHILDATGLRCPMPVLRTRRALESLNCGDQLTVYATDKGAITDMPAFCRETGHKLISQSDTGEKIVFEIIKGS